MIRATIEVFGNLTFYALIDQFTSLVKAYVITNGEESQTFYSYSKASKRFAELVKC